RSVASLQHRSTHTKYGSGLVVSKSLGIREEKGIFKARQKLESPLPHLCHRCGCTEQDAGAGLGPQLTGQQLPALPITLSLMPRALPCSCKPHEGSRGGSLSCCRNKGQRAESWGTATTPALAWHLRCHRCPPRSPCTASTERWGCPPASCCPGRCGSDGALLILLPVTPLQ
ncbi:unnamed protein product, partial [Bubo scandiacus]